MARTLVEAALTTRNARSKLPEGVHWRGLDHEVHLGYRKGKRGGVWLVRWRDGKGYRQAPIGISDDFIGEGTLDFAEAQRTARDFIVAHRAEAAAAARGPALTIRSSVESYIAVQDARESRRVGRQVQSKAASRLERHVIGRSAVGKRPAVPPSSLAEVQLHRLADRDFATWLAGSVAALKGTARQRIVNDLKAALNAAYSDNRDLLPAELPLVVKHGLAVEHTDADGDDDVARDNQILSDHQVGLLIRAAREVDAEERWDSDLFRMVLLLAATGARFSQLARARVTEFQAPQQRLMVPASRKGKGGKKVGLITVPIGPDVVSALMPAVEGRAADRPLLERWRHRQAPGGITWERVSRGAWMSSSELRRPWDTIRQRAGLPEVIPYALRHSSIVRAIRANLPIRLVAAQHDTSVAMIEKHYSKWISSGLEDMTRAAIVPLVP